MAWVKIGQSTKTYSNSELTQMMKDAGYTSTTSIVSGIALAGVSAAADALKLRLPPPAAKLLIAAGLGTAIVGATNDIQNNIRLSELQNCLQLLYNNKGTRIVLTTDAYQWTSANGNSVTWKYEPRAPLWLP